MPRPTRAICTEATSPVKASSVKIHPGDSVIVLRAPVKSEDGLHDTKLEVYYNGTPTEASETLTFTALALFGITQFAYELMNAFDMSIRRLRSEVEDFLKEEKKPTLH